MANLPILPTIRIWNDLPVIKSKGSDPSLRLANLSTEGATPISTGTPIGLLLSLTYAFNIGPLVAGPRPIVRII